MPIHRAALALTIGAAALAVAGCDDGGSAEDLAWPRDTSAIRSRSRELPFDVLIVVDDSTSMAVRQADVPHAVAEMIRRLVEPGCVRDVYNQEDPAPLPVRVDELGRCPPDTRPERLPILDMNVGVITTSRAAPGRPGQCTDEAGTPIEAPTDGGRLQARDASGEVVPTWQDRGFLAWDPEQARHCDGASGGYCPGIATADELAARLEAIVAGVGTSGCGAAAPLEAAWTFAGDPEPQLPGAEPGEVDVGLLSERAGFLREGDDLSQLIVIVVSDGDDASLRQDAVGAYFADPAQARPRARSECAETPDDRCCASCIDATPDGCDDEVGGCAAPGCTDPDACPENFHPEPDPGLAVPELCVEGKRRFGIDPCYPIERYRNAFSSTTVDPRRLDFTSDEGRGVINRLADHSPELVVIGDVEWQLIAEPHTVGYQTAEELEAHRVWPHLLPPAPPLPLLPPEPRRLLSLVRGLGAAGHLASIEPPTFEEREAEGRDLNVGFDGAPQAVAQPSARTDDVVCTLPLARDAEGGVTCELFELRDSDGDGDPSTAQSCTCDGLPGRVAPSGRAEPAAAALAEELAAEVEIAIDAGAAPPPYDCICTIPQLIGDAASSRACTIEEVPPLGVDGWCYVEGAKSGGRFVSDACGSSDPHGMRLVGRGLIGPIARLAILCDVPFEEPIRHQR